MKIQHPALVHCTYRPLGAQNSRPDPLAGRHSRPTERSPWIDPKKSSLLKYEFQLARENLPYEEFKPLEIYSWIERHGGEHLFFKGLARFAPMFPLHAYHGQVALWTSPPPSGYGNAILIVMGHDKSGTLRLVGGNFFTEPKPLEGSQTTSGDFFTLYDSGNERRQQTLVREAVTASISPEEIGLLRCVSRECEHFHTMAIYLTVLTSEGSLFHAAPAVIEGNKPADFSYEHFGEIK